MKDALLIGIFQQKELHFHRTLRLPAFAIDAPLPLFHLRRVPLDVVVEDITSVLLEIDPLLADLADQQHER